MRDCDHLVIHHKVNRELHRAALREMIADMNARKYDPAKETGKSILDEVRHDYD